MQPVPGCGQADLDIGGLQRGYRYLDGQLLLSRPRPVQRRNDSNIS
ncbi:hypothetical protein [Streptomyces mirabilis]